MAVYTGSTNLINSRDFRYQHHYTPTYFTRPSSSNDIFGKVYQLEATYGVNGWLVANGYISVATAESWEPLLNKWTSRKPQLIQEGDWGDTKTSSYYYTKLYGPYIYQIPIFGVYQAEYRHLAAPKCAYGKNYYPYRGVEASTDYHDTQGSYWTASGMDSGLVVVQDKHFAYQIYSGGSFKDDYRGYPASTREKYFYYSPVTPAGTTLARTHMGTSKGHTFHSFRDNPIPTSSLVFSCTSENTADDHRFAESGCSIGNQKVMFSSWFWGSASGAIFIFTKDMQFYPEMPAFYNWGGVTGRLNVNTTTYGIQTLGESSNQGTPKFGSKFDRYYYRIGEHFVLLDDRFADGDHIRGPNLGRTAYQYGEGRIYFGASQTYAYLLYGANWESFEIETGIIRLDTYGEVAGIIFYHGTHDRDYDAIWIASGCNRMIFANNGGTSTERSAILCTRDGQKIRTLSWYDDGLYSTHKGIEIDPDVAGAGEGDYGGHSALEVGVKNYEEQYTGREHTVIKNNLIFIFDSSYGYDYTDNLYTGYEFNDDFSDNGRLYIYNLDGELLVSISPADFGNSTGLNMNWDAFCTDGYDIYLFDTQSLIAVQVLNLRVEETLSGYYDEIIENFRY